jgi:hypothetical protein
MIIRRTHNRMGKRALAVALGFLLVLLATLPIIYPYLSSILAPSQAIAPEELNPNLLPNLPITPYALLDYANMILASAQAGNFTRAQDLAVYLNDLPPTVEHNLLTYLQQITELVSIIKSIKDRLDALTVLVANGQITQAEGLISQINSALSDASTRLGTLYDALDRIALIYQIDVSQQRTRLDGLASLLTQFRQLLQFLEASLARLDTRTATRLVISVTPNPVWINGTLHIRGILERSNGTGLEGRTVELWVNASQVGRISSGKEGNFTWRYDVSASRYSALAVYARYVPTGNDTNAYRPTVSDMLIVPVMYYGVSLAALASSAKVYVTEGFTVQGDLVNLLQQPLADERIVLTVDGSAVGDTKTDSAGGYAFTSSFPQGTLAGGHSLRVEFNPASGVYGSTGVGIGMEVYYMPSTVTVTSVPPSLTLSGQTITLDGNVTVNAKPFSQGLVTAFMGDRELGRANVGQGGTFQLPISVPLDVSGQNAVTLIFSPGEPWILSNQASAELNVMNSGLLGFASIGLAAAVVTLSTRTIELTPPSREKRRESEQLALEQLRAETVPTVTIHPARLTAFTDPRRCVQETYWESRRAIAEVLNETTPANETHREFAGRLSRKLGEAATPFSLLTLLFEVAEYSEHEITAGSAQAAINYLDVIAQRLNIQMRRDETWTEFCREAEVKAEDKLGQAGISVVKVTITPEAATVEVPWHLSAEHQALATSTLEATLGMRINVLSVRFCDRCRYKIEGSAVELEICPQCGTRLTVEFQPNG